MNASNYDVAGFGPEVKDKQLVAIIHERKEDRGRQMALKALLQRNNKLATKLAGEVLNNQFYDKRMKLVAATFLGENPSEEGVKCLCKELQRVENKQLRSKIIKSIGKTGGPESIKELEGLKTKEASFARSLIAYRHGIKGYYLPEIKNKKFSKRTKYSEIKPVAITAARKRKINELVETQLDVLGGYKQPKLKLNCSGNELYLMQSEAFSKKDLVPKMLEGPAIPLKIFEVNDCPRSAFLAYYVMTQPSAGKENELIVNLVTDSGRMAYSGLVEVKKEHLKVVIGTTEESVLPAVRIKGSYKPDSSKFEFESLFSA